MSEIPVEYDAIEENPAAPAAPDPPITVTAPWHNAGSTGAYAEPEVTTVRAYDKPTEDGPLVAKVLEPPARPRPARGRRASSAKQAETAETESAEDGDDPEEAA